MDIEEFRELLIDYVGTAMMSGFPMAIIDLSEIESASTYLELKRIANKVGFKYQDRDEER